jgi:hypothetical protein
LQGTLCCHAQPRRELDHVIGGRYGKRSEHLAGEFAPTRTQHSLAHAGQ